MEREVVKMPGLIIQSGPWASSRMSLSNLLIEALIKAYIELQEHQDVVGETYMAGAVVTRARSRRLWRYRTMLVH